MRTRAMWLAATIVATAVPAPSPGIAAPVGRKGDLTERVVATVRDRADGWFGPGQGVHGAAVAVVSETEALWQGLYGKTWRRGRPVTAATRFSVQSVSKNPTALAVLRAVDAGLVELDEPISAYLPDLVLQSRWDAHPEDMITLRHLLAHRAGLTHQAPVGSYFDGSPHTFEDHVDSISATWLRFPVGRRAAYSNLGPDLAAFILERVSGQPFARFVEQEVLEPLGMTRATFDFDRVRGCADCARGHYPQDPLTAMGPTRSPMRGAGGMWASLDDMIRLAQFHLSVESATGGFLSAELRSQVHRIQFPEPGQRSGMGLGIVRREVGGNGLYSIAHTGSGYGHRAVLHTYPGLGVAVVMMYNSLDSTPRDELIAALDEQVSESFGPVRGSSYTDLVSELSRVPLADPRIQATLGQYHSFLTLRVQDGRLMADTGSWVRPVDVFEDAAGQLHALLGEGAHYLRIYVPSASDPGGIVWTAGDGQVLQLFYHRPLPAADIRGPDDPSYHERAGSYHAFAGALANPVQFEISVENGYLAVDGLRCSPFAPGRCMTPDGEVLDSRGDRPLFKNIRLLRNPQ